MQSRSVGPRLFNQGNMSASLLHIALWNACTSDARLSVAAQALLIAVATTLNPEKNQIAAFKGKFCNWFIAAHG